MSRNDRPKACDIFGYRPVSFETAFPEIKNFEMEVDFEPELLRDSYTAHFSMDKRPTEYIDCRESLCYRGGFSVRDIFSEMVGKRETKYDGWQMCRGYLGSPKGKVEYQACVSRWKVRVSIEYNSVPTTPPETEHQLNPPRS